MGPNVTLLKGLAALAPAGMLLVGAALSWRRSRAICHALQVIGAGALTLVVLTHVCEGLHWIPRMRWGEEHSPGHYLDFSGAILGLTLFPAGYLLDAVKRRRAHCEAFGVTSGHLTGNHHTGHPHESPHRRG